ncbi:MAG: hypothetical protein V1806_01255 [Pseudomonadota bacterium]
MAKRRRFATSEMAMLGQAMEVAEERVSDFFHLSAGSWQRHPYQLRTRAELKPPEVSPRALAQVLKLRRPPLGSEYRGKDFFRICLQDHNLLGVVRREGAGELLLPLLVYVLAHELVHVVRFGRFQHLFEADEQERAREEAVVHGLSREILRPVRLPHLGRVLELYEAQTNLEHGQAWC